MSKGFCILRVAKIKSAGGVAVALGHNTRERETRNASEDDRKLNKLLVSESVESGMKRFRELLEKDKNPRKNAVMCLEYLITATNKSLDKVNRAAYLNESIQWLKKRHGAENILQVALHNDENTDPHIHVLVVPLALDKRNNMKLNASKWLDGKKKLTAMQTDFAQNVGEKFDLSRGVEGSVAKHERVKKFYGLVEKTAEMPKIEVPRPPRLGAIFDLNEWKKNAESFVMSQLEKPFESMQARSVKLSMVERELVNTKRTLLKTESRNGMLSKENERLKFLLENAPLSQIQAIREDIEQKREKDRNMQKDRSKGRGFSL